MKHVEIDFEKLYELASSRNEVDTLEHNIFALYLLFRHSYETRTLLMNTRISNNEKLDIIKDLPCFTSPNSTFFELLELLLENDMGNKMYYINENFSKVVSSKLNRILVQLFSAVPIPDSIESVINERLSKSLNKKVNLKNFVDPSLIGGMIIKLPDGKIYNFSYSKALSDIKFTLMEKD